MEVDPAALRGAADQIEALLSASAADGQAIDLGSGDVGDPTLQAAMAAFASSWTDGAAQLAEATQGIADGLRVAAWTYELTDAVVDSGFGRLLARLGGER